MTQQELANKVRMSKQQISDYANNRVTMSLKNAKTIASALRCHIDDLYEWIPIEPKRKR
jgi:DNA-binding XRE family transcriptional regulator